MSPQYRIPRNGHHQREALAARRTGQQWVRTKRPRQPRPSKEEANGQEPEQPLIAPQLVKSGGRYCVILAGKVISRCRRKSTALAVLEVLRSSTINGRKGTILLFSKSESFMAYRRALGLY